MNLVFFVRNYSTQFIVTLDNLNCTRVSKVKLTILAWLSNKAILILEEILNLIRSN